MVVNPPIADNNGNRYSMLAHCEPLQARLTLCGKGDGLSKLHGPCDGYVVDASYVELCQSGIIQQGRGEMSAAFEANIVAR